MSNSSNLSSLRRHVGAALSLAVDTATAPIGRDALVGALGWIVPVIATIVCTPIIVRALGAEEYGLFAVANGLVLGLANVSLGRPLSVALANGRAAPVIGPALVWAGLVGVGGALIVTLAAFGGLSEGLTTASGTAQHTHAVLIASAAGVFAVAVQGTLSGLLIGTRRFGTASAINIVTGCAMPIGYIALSRSGAGAEGLMGWLALVVLINGIAQAALARAAGMTWPGIGALRLRPLMDLWPSVAPVILAQVFGNVALLVERLWLARVSSTAELTTYVVPHLVAMLPHAATASICLALVPRFARSWSAGNRQALLVMYRRARAVTTGLGLATAVGFAVLGPVVLPRWLGGAITVNRWTIVGLAIGAGAALINIPAWMLADSIGEPRRNAWASFGLLAAVVLVGVPAAAMFGAPGSATGRAAVALVVVAHLRDVERRAFGAPVPFFPV